MKLGFLILSFFLLGLTTAHSNERLILDPNKVRNLALAQSLEIEIARNQQLASTYNIKMAQSIYDTYLKSKFTYERDKSQRTSPVFGTDNKTTFFQTELHQKSPLGGTVGIGYSNLKQSTDSIFASSPQLHDSQLYAHLRQPLIRNVLGYLDHKEIAKAKKQALALQAYAQSQIHAHVYQSLVLYWQLHFLEKNKILEEKALGMSGRQLTSNEDKEQLGVIEPGDLSYFKANKDIRQSLLLSAKNDLLNKQQELYRQLNLTSPITTITTSAQSIKPVKPPTLDEALKTAFELRPDYQAKIQELEAASINLKMAKNKLWPELDVLASFGLNGVDTTYQNAVDNIKDKYPRYQVGVELSFPLQNRYARSQVKTSELEKKNRILELKSAENEIKTQIQTALQTYKMLSTQVNILASAMSHQKARYTAEVSRFSQGRSDSDILIRAESDSITAEQMYLKSKVELKIAEANLAFAQGKILE